MKRINQMVSNHLIRVRYDAKDCKVIAIIAGSVSDTRLWIVDSGYVRNLFAESVLVFINIKFRRQLVVDLLNSTQSMKN